MKIESRRAVRYFDETGWETVAPGARQRLVVRDGRSLRLLELTRTFEEDGWCTTPHTGYVLEGAFDVEFVDRTEHYGTGDGFRIAGGEAGRHRAKVAGERVRLVLADTDGESPLADGPTTS